METTGRPPSDAYQLPASTRGRRKGKLRLLTRENLDGRSKAALAFDAIARGIAQDLGGEDRLSTVQKHLVEAFAGAALSLGDLNARLLLGQEIDLLAQSQAVNALVKLASRLGTSRVAREVVPSLQEYLRGAQREAAE
jgi:hypothetical protein